MHLRAEVCTELFSQLSNCPDTEPCVCYPFWVWYMFQRIVSVVKAIHKILWHKSRGIDNPAITHDTMYKLNYCLVTLKEQLKLEVMILFLLKNFDLASKGGVDYVAKKTVFLSHLTHEI